MFHIQELLKAKENLQCSIKQLHQLQRLIIQHIRSPNRVAASVATMRGIVEQQRTASIKTSTLQAIQAFMVATSQRDVTTDATIRHSFEAAMRQACAKKHQQQYTVLRTNNDADTQCSTGLVAQRTMQSCAIGDKSDQFTVRATVDACKRAMQIYSAVQQAFFSVIRAAVALQTDSGIKDDHNNSYETVQSVARSTRHSLASKQLQLKDEVMDMLAAAIQQRMHVLGSDSQAAELMSTERPQKARSPARIQPMPLQRASRVVSADIPELKDDPVDRRRPSRVGTTLQQPQYRRQMQELDMEARNLGNRLQEIPLIARERASTLVKSSSPSHRNSRLMPEEQLKLP